MILLALLLAALMILVAIPSKAELPDQWAGIGMSFNQYAAPNINGVAAYARKLTSNSRPTYSFSAVNFLSVERSPFRVLTTTETGLAQYLTKFGPFSVFGLGTAGLATAGSADGTSAGATFTGGGFAVAGVGRGVTIGPMLRIIKPAISERQWAAGLMIGWGK